MRQKSGNKTITLFIISIRGMYLRYRDIFDEKNFKMYDLPFPTEQDIKNLIIKYEKITGSPIYKDVDNIKIRRDKFKSLFV